VWSNGIHLVAGKPLPASCYCWRLYSMDRHVSADWQTQASDGSSCVNTAWTRPVGRVGPWCGQVSHNPVVTHSSIEPDPLQQHPAQQIVTSDSAQRLCPDALRRSVHMQLRISLCQNSSSLLRQVRACASTIPEQFFIFGKFCTLSPLNRMLLC